MPKFVVSFRIMGAGVEPDAISKALDLRPTESHRKGDERRGREGRTYAPYSEGLWCMTVSVDDASGVDAPMKELLGRLVPHKEALAILRSLHRADIFVGVFSRDGNSAFELSTENQALLNQLSLPLSFDVYD
jgi:hypothetical protein